MLKLETEIYAVILDAHYAGLISDKAFELVRKWYHEKEMEAFLEVNKK